MPYPFVERRYSWLAETPLEALKVPLTRPWVVIPPVTEPPKLIFLVRLFGPLLFLPLLGWPVIGLAFPVLIYLMLTPTSRNGGCNPTKSSFAAVPVLWPDRSPARHWG